MIGGTGSCPTKPCSNLIDPIALSSTSPSRVEFVLRTLGGRSIWISVFWVEGLGSRLPNTHAAELRAGCNQHSGLHCKTGTEGRESCIPRQKQIFFHSGRISLVAGVQKGAAEEERRKKTKKEERRRSKQVRGLNCRLVCVVCRLCQEAP